MTESVAKRARRPAHRPSRRQDLVAAAVQVFARDGYAESSVEDVAAQAGVVPTAIYYHFGSKEELLHSALQESMDAFSTAILGARTEGAPVNFAVLRRVVRAGWAWWLAHPDEARVISRYAQSTTGQALDLRASWVDRHRRRAFDYLSESAGKSRGKTARSRRAADSLAIGALIDVILACEAEALPGGFLAGLPEESLPDAVADVCVRLLGGDGQAA